MKSLADDLPPAFRILRRRPGFTAAAVVALSLGIGANTAIFSVVNAVLLRPLPFPQPDSLVMLWENDTREGNHRNDVAPANFLDWQRENRVLESMAYFHKAGTATLAGEEPEPIEVAGVSGNLFSVLGVNPVLGRGFWDEDAKSWPPRTAVVSYGLWQRRFGGQPGVLGKEVSVEGLALRVVGVMPRELWLPEPADLWFPRPLAESAVRGRYSLRVAGRLRPGITLEQARANFSTIASALEREHPNTNAGRGVTIISMRDQLSGETRPALLVLMGAVGFVLLIACANVANLLLVRAAGRRKEMAIRAALGAGRLRLVRQLLAESLMLGLLGGAVGLLLAAWGAEALVRLAPESLLPTRSVSLDPAVLGFTLGMSLFTGILFGLAPAVRASRLADSGSLREGKGHDQASGRNFGAVLVISEVALALVLLSAAGLLIRSLVNVYATDTGMDAARVLTAQLSLPYPKYRERQAAAFYTELLERLQRDPNIRTAGAISRIPLAGDRSTSSVTLDGQVLPEGFNNEVHYRVATPDYFRAMGIRLRAGRPFTARDNPEAAGVVMVNHAMAARFWPGEEAVGKRIRLGSADKGPWLEVVGVVGDARNFGLRMEPQAEVYIPHLQSPWGGMRLVLQTAHDPAAAVSTLCRHVREMDRELAVSQIATMGELLDRSVSRERFSTALLAIFAAAALLLAASGVYGVISYSVAQRTYEIGVRMALGARGSDVLRMVIGRGLLLTTAGIAGGLAGALALMPVISHLLFGVSAADPATFGLVSLVLASVAALACYLPARRASRIDPAVALRSE